MIKSTPPEVRIETKYYNQLPPGYGGGRRRRKEDPPFLTINSLLGNFEEGKEGNRGGKSILVGARPRGKGQTSPQLEKRARKRRGNPGRKGSIFQREGRGPS